MTSSPYSASAGARNSPIVVQRRRARARRARRTRRREDGDPLRYPALAASAILPATSCGDALPANSSWTASLTACPTAGA